MLKDKEITPEKPAQRQKSQFAKLNILPRSGIASIATSFRTDSGIEEFIKTEENQTELDDPSDLAKDLKIDPNMLNLLQVLQNSN